MLTAESVEQHARTLGFDLCGVAPAEALPEAGRMREWLARGYAGDMGYLPRTARLREDVRRILPSARSVIVTGTVYNTNRPYSVEVTNPAEALVSRYAWGEDYHDVIGGRLNSLLDWMRARHRAPFEARAFVDTGPIHERAHAERAGLGWIGKHGCLINPDLGSWLFLSAIVCSLPLVPDEPALDRCGACTLCLDACPTGAIVEPHVLDATRCLSYLTIELRRGIPEPIRADVGRHVFGCDICQDVCPWNQSAARSEDPAWQPRPALDHPRLLELWNRSDDGLAELARGSAMSRAGVTSLRRNLAVALGNSADPAAAGALDPSTRPERSRGARSGSPRAGSRGESGGPDADAPSLDDRMVQEHVRWARVRHQSRPGRVE
jgi:epoxyqueuosine reductase